MIDNYTGKRAIPAFNIDPCTNDYYLAKENGMNLTEWHNCSPLLKNYYQKLKALENRKELFSRVMEDFNAK
jgi:hypothetical protein